MNKQHMEEAYHRMSKNFMTPNVIKFEIVDNQLVELSEGTGINNEPVFGVSEFVYEEEKWNSTKRGGLFRTRIMASKAYKNLLNK